MNSVGIDVSKGKSVVSVLRPLGEIVHRPFVVNHTESEIRKLSSILSSMEGDVKIVMEHTGRYYKPLARILAEDGFFVSVVNPKLVKDFGANSLRKVKTDKADAVKISKYGLDNWQELRQYTDMCQLREQLKLLNHQFDFFTTQRTALKNNLIGLLDLTFPGVNTFFDSPAREDGSQKWVDFAETYWHVDCIRKLSLNKFTEHYEEWCKRRKYNFSSTKAKEIYETAKELVSVLPKDKVTKMILKQAVEQVNDTSKRVECIRSQMNEVASKLPEYPVVMSMVGVGPSLGPQLIAELGDITRFTHRSAIIAFAGVDPGVNDSGMHSQKSVHITKRGSAALRKTLFKVMAVLIKLMPEDDPVYAFMDKKRSEGKPYYVYMTAGCNKFLRIYYGRVKKYLAEQEAAQESPVDLN